MLHCLIDFPLAILQMILMTIYSWSKHSDSCNNFLSTYQRLSIRSDYRKSRFDCGGPSTDVTTAALSIKNINEHKQRHLFVGIFFSLSSWSFVSCHHILLRQHPSCNTKVSIVFPTFHTAASFFLKKNKLVPVFRFVNVCVVLIAAQSMKYIYIVRTVLLIILILLFQNS